MSVKVIKLGTSNIGSLINMLEYLDVSYEIVSCPSNLKDATKILLPGVGSFDAAMKELTDTGLNHALLECLENKSIPILGICLGMQLLLNGSDEGRLPGLGLIEGHCIKFTATANLKVPHMAWNAVKDEGGTKLLSGLTDPRFYFVHSYYAQVKHDQNIIFSATYGKKFAAGVRKENIVGVQFHPEKSHKFGLKLMSNFLEGSL